MVLECRSDFQTAIENSLIFKKNKKGQQEHKKFDANKDEDLNVKMQALMQKIKFSGKPKIIDLTSVNLFPALL